MTAEEPAGTADEGHLSTALVEWVGTEIFALALGQTDNSVLGLVGTAGVEPVINNSLFLYHSNAKKY